MKGEIDGDFYCSVNYVQMGEYEPSACYGKEHGRCEGCSACHRKWPTPEQYKEEYGEEYPKDMPVWCLLDTELTCWHLTTLHETGVWRLYVNGHYLGIKAVVCACTPWGKPPTDWRPE